MKNSMPKILVVDDDHELCELLDELLKQEGFDPTFLYRGEHVLEVIRSSNFEAIVLDIMLPVKSGLEILREIRQEDMVPVLMLTARGEDSDRILGLELGADDYLPKPFNPRELSARLRAILRRSATKNDAKELEIGSLYLSKQSRRVLLRGKELTLTGAEFSILAELMNDSGSTVSKEILCEKALNRPLQAFDRSVDVHVSNLRKKLAAGGAHDLIVSVRGRGYQLAS